MSFRIISKENRVCSSSFYTFENGDYDVRRIAVSGNLNIPWKIIIGLFRENIRTVTELYQVIEKINFNDGLTDSSGYFKKIDIDVVIPQIFSSSEYFPFSNPADSFSAISKKLENSNVKKGSHTPVIEKVVVPGEEVVWIQDLGEIGAVKLDGCSNMINCILDVNYDPLNPTFLITSKFAEKNQMPLIETRGIGAENSDNGDAGGNIEATHEGLVYTGSNISDSLLNHLEELLGYKPVLLSTKWLNVGHVDEILFFVPAKNRCSAVMVYADPVMALNIILKVKKWNSPSFEALYDSINYFLKEPGMKKDAYTIEDFDFKRPLRNTGSSDERLYGKYSDWFIRENLNAYIKIVRNVEILKKSSRCLEDTVPIPVIFKESEGDYYYESAGMEAVNPLTNAVVIRDHVIFPDTIFKEIAEEKLAPVLGGREKIHFVESGFYHSNSGSIHCGTMVLRDVSNVFDFRKK